MDWPLDRPAREVLALSGQTQIRWAVFDPDWYRRAYQPDSIGTPEQLLDDYLTLGQAAGHSPNIFFDEAWHRTEYPRIADAVKDGEYDSAFDAYCRRGSLDRTAHWLFNELFYRERYRDLTDDVFVRSQVANGYDHYLRHGIQEDRIGHVLFDPPTYLANFEPAELPAILQLGAYQHYLQRLDAGAPELRTSVYFDPAWYAGRYPEVARAIAAGQWKSALHHYLCNDTPTEFDPLESFSEAHYLSNDPGLRQVVADRDFRNGYMHFLRFGARELRSPSPSLDLAWYAGQPGVWTDIGSGKAADAFTHWLTIGSRLGLPAAEPREQRVDAGQAMTVAARFAAALLPVAGRFGYRFDQPNDPAISVILVVRDAFATTMATIASLRASTALQLELVIIDLASSDEMRSIQPYLPGAKVLRLEGETDWAQAAEAGRQLASAPLVLFLSGACHLAFNAIDRARARLTADAAIGAVGGLVLQPHGVVAQAGGILWQDGGIHDYLSGESPLAPEANFVRGVDFCSRAFLLLRADLIARLDGFDQACSAGYEMVDLCLRIAAAGLRVVYDPSVMLTETAAAVPHATPNAHFLSKHAGALAQRSPPGGPVQAFARHAAPRQPRILFIEDTVPLRRIGSGFVRSNDVVRAMIDLGAAVTVFPINGCDHSLARVYGDMPDTVEVMHTLSLDHLSGFLQGRPAYYDLIWVARAHNLQKVKPILARIHGEDLAGARIVLDTEALTPYRDAQRASLGGHAYDPEPAMLALRDLAAPCVSTVAVTPEETRVLRQHGLHDVFTVGHAVEVRPTLRNFAQRASLLFVGAIHTNDSPNLDSLEWFVDAVLPLVEQDLGWETRLTIIGYIAPGIDLNRLRHHPRVTLRGPLEELDPVYNAHRVFIAPTRYAAGTPYKLLEAASRGVPIVCTDLLRRQIGWTNEQEILAADPADPAGFAAAILALYRDESLWRKVREGALRRLRRDHGWAEFSRAVGLALTANGG